MLRYGLGLTGTKQGCDKGDCGTCTIILDGQPALACLTLALSARGRFVQTVEGLGVGGQPHPLQAAFARLGAAQCGFCTPGMLMSASAHIEDAVVQGFAVTAESVSQALAGNLCRCTGYTKIVQAVVEAAKEIARDSRAVDEAGMGSLADSDLSAAHQVGGRS